MTGFQMVVLETIKLVTTMPTIPGNIRTLQFFGSYSSLSNSADVTDCDTKSRHHLWEVY